MDISSLAMNIPSQAGLQQDISVAMLSNSMDSSEIAGQGLEKMIDLVPTPNLGGSIDIKL